MGLDINSYENLVIAPLGGGVHSTKRITALVDELVKFGKDKASVIEILKKHGEIAAFTGHPMMQR